MLLTLFRVLIFCRLPISLFALGGLKLFLGDASTEELSMLVFLGLLVYLGVVSVKLFRLRADAHRYAWFLLALEAM